MRIGIGYDIHKLVSGRKLLLGGVDIPYEKGLEGHSDADGLLHAVCDALLGAAGLEDIGELFPDSRPEYKDISSAKLLAEVGRRVRQKGYKVENIDAVIIAQEPRLSAYKKDMIGNIGSILELGQERINIKSKTNEGLGELGKKEAISVQAVCLLSEV